MSVDPGRADGRRTAEAAPPDVLARRSRRSRRSSRPWDVLRDVLWADRPVVLRGLALFTVANLLLVTLPFGRYTLAYPRNFLQARMADDSWGPMAEAARYLRDRDGAAGGGETVYDVVFFQRHVKFQYPLTSLLPFRAFGIPDDPTHSWLLVVTWAAVCATAVLVALILLRALRDLAPRFAPRRRVDALLLGFGAFGLTVAFHPVAKGASLGQIQVWINCLFAATVWLWLTDRRVLAGIAAGLACTMKPQLGLILLWALLRKRWGFSAAFAGTAGAAGILSLAAYGLRDNLGYLDGLSFMARHGEAFFANQSVNGMVNRLLGNGQNGLDNADVWFAPFSWPVYLATMGSSLVLVLGALLWRRGEHDPGPADATSPRGSADLAAGTVDLGIVGLAATMASPIAWEHHYGVLIAIYAVLLPAVLRWPVYGRWSVPVLAASYAVASNSFPDVSHVDDVVVLAPVQSNLLVVGIFILVTSVKVRHAASVEARTGTDQSSASGSSTWRSPLAAARAEARPTAFS